MAYKSSNQARHAFTVVELLIVIVVIAIIAAISIVAYSSTTQKATISSIQADLTNAKKQLLAFQASSTTNSFPTAINCTNPSATEICLKSSGGSSFTYKVNNASSPPSFTLTNTSGSTSYKISNISGVLATPNFVTTSLVLNLDATDATSYPGSGKIWYDTTGNVTPITLGGNVSRTNRSVVFDGSTTSALASWPSALNINDSTTDRSWEVVVKVINNTIFVPLFGHKTGISCGYYCNGGIYSSFGSIRFVSYDGVNYQWLVSGLNFDGINFYDIVATFSGTDQKPRIYVNGQLKATASSATTINYGGGMFYYDFGYDSKYNNGFLNGEIGAIRFYKGKALSDNEVLQNYNAIKDIYGI